jgi:hypothetical protein
MAFQIKNTFACAENWDKMSPTEKGKFCEVCTKEVIDFTTLSKNEIIAVFKKNNYQALCARAYSTQLSTIYFEDSLENVSWNLPFWQKFLLVFLVCFGPEFLNVNLVFAQDSTLVQTEEVVQDSVQINDSLFTEMLVFDSNQIVPKFNLAEHKDWDNLQLDVFITYGSMMILPYRIEDDQAFAYLENGINPLVNKDQEEEKNEIPIKQSKDEKEIITENEFRPINSPKPKVPSKKQIPEKLLFVPMSSFLKPKQNNQKAT